MSDEIKKEALVSTRDNPFASKKSWKGWLASIGKGSLEEKSDSYKEANRMMNEMDTNIRAAFKAQQGFAKEAY